MTDKPKPTSPVDTLNMVYDSASPIIKGFLENSVASLLICDVPVFMRSVEQGRTIDVKSIKALTATYTETMALFASKKSPLGPCKSPYTKTVESIGLELAEIIDKGLKRVFLEDTLANRFAVDSIVANHAKLLSAISAVALSESQLKDVEGDESDS